MEVSDGRRLTSEVPSGNSAELRRRCPSLKNDDPDLASGGTPQDSALNHSTTTAGSSASGFANHRETREEGFHVDSGREVLDDHWQVLPTTLPGTSSIAAPHDDSNNSAMSTVTGRPGGKARRTFPKKASCFEVHGNRFTRRPHSDRDWRSWNYSPSRTHGGSKFSYRSSHTTTYEGKRD